MSSSIAFHPAERSETAASDYARASLLYYNASHDAARVPCLEQGNDWTWGGILLQLGYPSSPSFSLMNQENAQSLAIAMIESREGLRNIEKIAAVPGLDGLLFGCNDFALDNGLEMSGDGALIACALNELSEVAGRNGICAGVAGAAAETLTQIDPTRPWFFVIGMDFRVLRSAVAAQRAMFVNGFRKKTS